MNVKDLIKFFIDRPALSVPQFGIEAGYAQGQYFKVYFYHQRARYPKKIEDTELVPATMYKRILPVLLKYGYSEPVEYNEFADHCSKCNSTDIHEINSNYQCLDCNHHWTSFHIKPTNR